MQNLLQHGMKIIKVIGIYLSHRDEFVVPWHKSPGPNHHWTYAKFMWRSSVITLATIQDHLLIAHLIEANTLANTSKQFLPATHPLRIFLKPFTYRAININNSAAISLFLNINFVLCPISLMRV